MDESAEQAPATEEELLRQRAEKRVKEKIRLLQHAGTYVAVNIFMFLIWGFTSNWDWSNPWFVWVLIGWGLGLGLNAVAYFSGSRGEAARDRMVQKEMKKIKEDG